MSSILLDLGIIKNETASSIVFESLLDDRSFLDVEYNAPNEYVMTYWEALMNHPKHSTLAGNIFELIITTLLYRENLLPIYVQAQVAFVPNVRFDALLYNKEFGPISLSLKTSLRERYKQADLEAIALKYVHRKAKCHLLTMHEQEAASVKAKIKSGDVIGLDSVVICSNDDINNLIANLKTQTFEVAGSVEIITSHNMVVKG